MNQNKEEIQKTADSPNLVSRDMVMGDMAVSYTTLKKEMNLGPLLKGLPNDKCQARHWGYVLKGSFVVDYGDHKETCEEGDIFYLAPGHVPIASEGTEIIQFTPKDENDRTVAAMAKNMAELRAAT
jgi:hypothetical protein